MSDRLDFHQLGLRNFLSFPAQETVLPLEGGLVTAIFGENRDTGGEDSRNGVGKSAMLIDALCYCFYGKVVRGISNQKLINKMGKGQMVVWVEFSRGPWSYRVERCERPGKLLLLRKPVGSDDDFKVKENRKFKYDIARGKNETTKQIIEILGFDINLFEYLVANTSESDEFFKISEEKQRRIIEPLFGFTIMSIKADRAKDKKKALSTELLQAESANDATRQANERIEREIGDLGNKSVNWVAEHEQAIAELKASIEVLESADTETEIAILQETARLQESLSAITMRVKAAQTQHDQSKQDKRRAERDAQRAISDMESAEATIKSMDESVCPTCKQHWEPEPEIRQAAESKLEEAQRVGNDAVEAIDAADTAIATAATELEAIRTEFHATDHELNELKQVQLVYDSVEEAAGAGVLLESMREQLASTEAATDPYKPSIDRLQTEAIQEVDDSAVQELRRIIRHYTYLIELLTKRDSFLRQNIIDRWLPILNRRIAQWLEVLELPHQIQFQPDLTLTITHFHEEFDYGNLSRGQRARLRVALNLSFQDVFEYMNYPINLLVVDELLDAGICPRGAENAVTALKQICASKNKRVYLITHRDDISARVDDTMKVIMEGNRSRIEQ